MGVQEHWKIIPSHPRYEASSLGRIRRASTGRIRKLRLDSRGYYVIRMIVSGKELERKVSRLVAETFLGPSKQMVRHLNDDRLDNRLENLAYGTAKENAEDYYRNKGATLLHQNKKLIRQLQDSGLKQAEIAEKLGVCVENLFLVVALKRNSA